jgi:hypothetical protein
VNEETNGVLSVHDSEYSVISAYSAYRKVPVTFE